ncbi:unnamed protein product [Closterium sp. Yama58-4]|nr:unnamed protein product [Closterium sp. Yama58-4]
MPVPVPQPPAAQNVSGQQLEVKLAAQQGDIQQLLMENQRLAATHVALRQELAAAQGEIQRLKSAVGEKDQVVRGLMDTKAKLEADLRGADTLRQELQAARQELQGTRGEIQALTQQQQQQQLQQQGAQLQQQQAKIQQQAAQIGQMNQDLNRMHADVQLLPKLRQEIDGLTQELALARQAVEYEKKANMDLVEQRAAMEKNLIASARDVERLKAQIANLPPPVMSQGIAR